MQNLIKLTAIVAVVFMAALPVQAEERKFSAHYDLGVFAYEEGDYANAENHFKKASEINPEDLASRHFLGKTYIRTGRFDEALILLKAVWETDPEWPGLTYDLADAYFNLKDYPNAARLFRSIADEDPGDVSAGYHAGISLFKSGRYSEAQGYLVRAADQSPTVKDSAYFYAGICYLKTGQTDTALEKFEYLRTYGQSEEIKLTAAGWIREIKKSKKPYGIFLKTGVQYDDNVNLGSIGEDRISEEEDFVSTLFLSTRYDVIDNGAWQFGAGYSHFQSLHADLSEYDMAAFVGSIYGKYRRRPFVWGFTYYPAYYRLGSDGFLMRHQLRPEMVYEAGNDLLFRLALDYLLNNHLEDDARSGHTRAGEFEIVSGVANKKGRVFVSTGFEDNHADHPDYAYVELNGKAGVSFNLPQKISLGIVGKVSGKDYDNTDTTFNVKRNDTQYRGSVVVSRSVLYDWLVASGEFEMIRNDSNIDEFEYRETITTLSLSAIY